MCIHTAWYFFEVDHFCLHLHRGARREAGVNEASPGMSIIIPGEAGGKNHTGRFTSLQTLIETWQNRSTWHTEPKAGENKII